MTDMTGKGYGTHGALAEVRQWRCRAAWSGHTTHLTPTPGRIELEINGTDGRILIDDTVKRYTFHRAGEETGEVWEAGYFNDLDREFHRTFDRYLDPIARCIHSRRCEPPVHARARVIARWRWLTRRLRPTRRDGALMSAKHPIPRSPFPSDVYVNRT